MKTTLTQQELGMLQLRIAASPRKDRAHLQVQLDSLVVALDRSWKSHVEQKRDQDEDVDALFDNMPV